MPPPGHLGQHVVPGGEAILTRCPDVDEALEQLAAIVLQRQDDVAAARVGVYGPYRPVGGHCGERQVVGVGGVGPDGRHIGNAAARCGLYAHDGAGLLVEALCRQGVVAVQ